jgi:hypothetical protein
VVDAIAGMQCLDEVAGAGRCDEQTMSGRRRTFHHVWAVTLPTMIDSPLPTTRRPG